MSEVLQRQVTMDEALLSGVQTYRNGCNFRLIVKADGSYWLEHGCYGLPHLAQGAERLLFNWLGDGPRKLEASPKTLHELLRREPCRWCGGTLHEARDT
jgi:hypothetical protein